MLFSLLFVLRKHFPLTLFYFASDSEQFFTFLRANNPLGRACLFPYELVASSVLTVPSVRFTRFDFSLCRPLFRMPFAGFSFVVQSNTAANSHICHIPLIILWLLSSFLLEPSPFFCVEYAIFICICVASAVGMLLLSRRIILSRRRQRD